MRKKRVMNVWQRFYLSTIGLCQVSLDAVLPWDSAAVDATTKIKIALAAAGTLIGPNDTAIAGHAISARAILVTNNLREFERVPGLALEDWVK